jgi:hypothetical protein
MKIILTESQIKLLTEATLAYDEEFKQLVRDFEGKVIDPATKKHITYDDATMKPVKSSNQVIGTMTIGYGTTDDIYPEMRPGQKISDSVANELLSKGIQKKESDLRRLLPNFDKYPRYVRAALLNAKYRGDIGKNTIALINQGKWDLVSKEYLNHTNYKNPGKFPGVKKRMGANAMAFDRYANELKNPSKKQTTNQNDFNDPILIQLEFKLKSSTSMTVHRFKTSKGYRLEVGPYPPSAKEGRYLVFFRDGRIIWYNGNNFDSYVGRWDTMTLIIGSVESKSGRISLRDALNNPVKHFATVVKTSGVYYTVKQNDTLSKIAAQYDKSVTPQTIMKLNNLKGESIKPGQKLRIK